MFRVKTVLSGPSGQPGLSTMHFTGASTQATVDAAVAAVGVFWGAVDAYMHTTQNWATEAEVMELSLAGVPTAVWQGSVQSGSGASAGEIVPFATQGLIRWRTGDFTFGRELRGRTFIPGTTIDTWTNGTIGTTPESVWNAAAATLIAGTTAVLVVWSPTHDFVADVTAASAWREAAVLTSRRD
jgi:hypothetical protein